MDEVKLYYDDVSVAWDRLYENLRQGATLVNLMDTQVYQCTKGCQEIDQNRDSLLEHRGAGGKAGWVVACPGCPFTSGEDCSKETHSP